MRQLRNSLALVALFATGCAFTDGTPWGQAEFQFAASFDPPSSRVDDGALKTAKNYLLAIETLSVDLQTVGLEVLTQGEAMTFDPADPPEGYGLCHNGHCHSDSGELVDYEDIEVEIGGGDYVASQLLDTEVTLDDASVWVAGGACSNDCELPRGALGNVQVSIAAVHVSATVSDVADSFDPYTIDLEIPVDTTIAVPVDGRIGPGEPGVVELDIRFDPGAALFDGVDFAVDAPAQGTPNVSQLSDAIRASLEINAVLDVNVERRSFDEE